MLQFQNLRSQRLTQVQNGTTAKLLEIDFLRNLLANLIVRLNLLGSVFVHQMTLLRYYQFIFPGNSAGKESACNVGDPGLIPGLGRSPGGGMGAHSSILAWRIPWTV